jgi:preprotein translocase subunit SecD
MERPTSSLDTVTVTALLLVAGVAPAGPVGAAAAADGPGQAETPDGAVVELSVAGTTAEGIDVAPAERDRVRGAIATELDVSNRSVAVRDDTVEIRHRNVSTAALEDALTATGVDTANVTVRAGVTDRTRELVADVLRRRFAAAGLPDAEVTPRAVDGQPGIAVRAPAATPAEVRRVATREGRVELVARAPGSDGGNRTAVLAANGDFASVGPPQQRSGRPPGVPVTLSGEAAERFSSRLVDLGFTGEGVEACRDPESPDPSGYCIYTRLNGETVFVAGMSASLADLVRSGDFAENPRFVLRTRNLTRAQELRVALESGALQAPLEVESAGPITGDADRSPADGPARTTGGGSPGFTAALAVLAVLALGLLARWD